MIKYYLPQIIFFCIFFAPAVAVLYYIRRKNPDPRFRPNLGEMTLMTVIAVFICGGMAFGIGSLFKSENDGTSLSKKPNEGAGWSAGTGATDFGSGKSKDNKPQNEDGEPAPRRLNDRN